MEIIGLAGFVFAATAIGALIYERERDVLHGPYIEGRKPPQPPEWLRALAEMLDPVFELADRLSFRARHAVYLASLA